MIIYVYIDVVFKIRKEIKETKIKLNNKLVHIIRYQEKIFLRCIWIFIFRPIIQAINVHKIIYCLHVLRL